MSTKRILIIDDSEIDREVLTNILSGDFDVIQADNGFSGLEIILSGKPRIDVVLLDISMPVLDGFKVLQLMAENDVRELPVFLITAEATRDNVEKAAQFGISNYILKPFEPQTILGRLRTMFGIEESAEEEVVITNHGFSESSLSDTNAYAASLREVFKGYLKNRNKDDGHYVRVSELVKLLLNEYTAVSRNHGLDSDYISVISQAAYLYNIGIMTVPDALLDNSHIEPEDRYIYNSHTTLGANIIWSNHSLPCRYFVEVCADMCMHHHERFDGGGYPHGLVGNDNSIYTMLCIIAASFDSLFYDRPEINDRAFEIVLEGMRCDKGAFDPKLLELLSDSKASIVSYYRKL